MAPGANILYYGAASCFDADFLDTLANGSSTTTRPRSSRTRGATSSSERRAATSPPTSRSSCRARCRASASCSRPATTATSSWPAARVAARLPDLRPVRDRRRRHVARRSAPTGSSLWQTGWGTQKYSLSANGKSWEPRQAFLYGAGGGFSSLFNQPAVPGRASSPRRRRDAPFRTWRWTATRRPACWSARRRSSRTASHYGEYRIGGTSLSSPLFAGMPRWRSRTAGGRRRVSLNPTIYAQRGHGGVQRRHRPGPDAGNVRVRLRQRLRRRGRPPLLRPHVRPGHEPRRRSKGWDDVTGIGSPNTGWLTAVPH